MEVRKTEYQCLLDSQDADSQQMADDLLKSREAERFRDWERWEVEHAMNQPKHPDGMISVQIKGRVDGGPSQTMAWFMAPSSALCVEVAITPPGPAHSNPAPVRSRTRSPQGTRTRSDKGCEDQHRDEVTGTDNIRGETHMEGKGRVGKDPRDDDRLHRVDDGRDGDGNRDASGIRAAAEGPSVSTEKNAGVRSASSPTEARGTWSHSLASPADIVLEDSQV